MIDDVVDEARDDATKDDATRYVNLLLKGEYAYRNPGARFFDADLTNDASRFLRQLRYCREASIGFPCLNGLRTPFPIPIDIISTFELLNVALPTEEDVRTLPSSHRFTLLITRLFEGSDVSVAHYSPDEAYAYFKDRLTSFTSLRFADCHAREGFRHRVFGKLSDLVNAFRFQSPVPKHDQIGLPFTVFTKTNGLKVNYSPAYFFNPNLVFGAPTSPVDKWMNPGRFIFGVGAIDAQVRFSPDEYDIPPQREAHMEA